MLKRSLILAALLAGGGGVNCPSAAQELPSVPQGVEVQARGPVHEAYASPTTDPVPTRPVAKKPPAPIEELPPAEKPEGDVVWIAGYWAWDDDRGDFLWVSGVWRKPPPGKQWVAGYWREQGQEWQWVPGFWTAAAPKEEEQQITYLPAPPAAPEVAPPGKAPGPESFYVPGAWVWTGDRYVWRAGYWARMQPGYVWVPDHYRWTPSGYVYVPGYWDLALKSRGILYAPVVIDPALITVGWTYTPAYAVRDTVIVEAMFVRPAVCHYYFGDYYGPRYRTLGYESCVVYSRRRYDSIVVYECYERRDPAWLSVQINLYNDRCAGRAPLPPRTLVQQNKVVNNTTIVNNTTVVNNNITMIAPTKQVAVTKNTTLVKLDDTTRQQARAQAAAVQQVAKQRTTAEVAPPPGAPRQARVASLSVPKAEPVKPGMKAPVVKPAAAAVKPATPTSASLDRPRSAAPAAAAGKPAAVGAPRAAGPATPGAKPATATPAAKPAAVAPRTLGATASPATPGTRPGARPTAAPQPSGARWLPAVPGARPGTAAQGQPARRPPAKKDEKERERKQ